MKQSPIQGEHIKKLAWAIWFSQAELAVFREGDWMNAKQDLWEFIKGKEPRPPEKQYAGTPHFGPDTPFGEWFNWHAGPKTMANVQEALRLHLNDLVFDGERPEDLPVCTYPPIKDVEIEVLGYGPDLPFKQSITKSADLVTQARGVLFDHLVSSGILRGQLRVCPTCRRIFLLGRRPRPDQHFHCSIRCSRLAATRRYREKQAKEGGEELKAKDRERSHQRYVKKQQKKYGRKVKVPRRPRKA